MNRVEKLLFSKRSPLRRALLEETSREERLKLVPDIAREMRRAGLISVDLELESASYSKIALRETNTPYDVLAKMSVPLATIEAYSNAGLSLARSTLNTIARRLYGAIIFSFFDGEQWSAKALLEAAQADLFQYADTFFSKRGQIARELSGVGLAKEISASPMMRMLEATANIGGKGKFYKQVGDALKKFVEGGAQFLDDGMQGVGGGVVRGISAMLGFLGTVGAIYALIPAYVDAVHDLIGSDSVSSINNASAPILFTLSIFKAGFVALVSPDSLHLSEHGRLVIAWWVLVGATLGASDLIITIFELRNADAENYKKLSNNPLFLLVLLLVAVIFVVLWPIAIVFSVINVLFGGRDRKEKIRYFVQWAFVSILFIVAVTPGVVKIFHSKTESFSGAEGTNLIISIQSCPSEYRTIDAPGRYLRVGGAAATGDARLALGNGAASIRLPDGGVLVSDTTGEGDWALVKRGPGTKPVKIVSSANVEISDGAEIPAVEPAYINVKLCVRDGADLPPELEALRARAGGANE